MNRIFLLLIFVGCCFSCTYLKKLEEEKVINGNLICYPKVKVTINSISEGTVTLHGYISIIRDSSICFKFYGPLSLEVASGYIDRSSFKIYDNYNKKLFNDSTFRIADAIRIDEKMLESLIIGNKSSFIKFSELLNTDIKVDSSKLFLNELGVIRRNKSCKINWVIKNGKIKSVSLNFDSENLFYIKIELIAQTFERRVCKFKY